MTKYIIYAEDDKRPGKQVQIRKAKREYEALDFVTDMKNLAKYGCMTLVMDADGKEFVWDEETRSWLPSGVGGD